MYVTLLLLHVKMMKSSFWGKNVLEFGFVNEIVLIILISIRYVKLH
ncbi:hypothetical protein protein [Bacillus cereus G9241]|nr:hypothetical protein protein [Bacillus cereus G9241]